MKTTDADVIAALRLAMEAAADDKAARVVAEALLQRAPKSDPRNTESVHLLIRTIKASKAEFALAG